MKITKIDKVLVISGEGHMVLVKNGEALHFGDGVENIAVNNWWFQMIGDGFKAKLRSSVAVLRYIWQGERYQ